ncbi:MAG: Bug family tripartite tricarboxylate transporter substrate binding protein [Lautropia sp.]
MTRTRRLMLAAAMALPFAAAVQAQTFPSQPVKVLVGYAAGGPLDTVARIVAQGMAESLGHAVVVDNKPGASGLIATNLLKQAPPDGYTILFVPSTFVVNPIMMPKAPYDPIKDFALISHLATLATLMVTEPESKIRSVADLVAAAKAAPGAVTYASTGAGGPAHLASELFQTQTGTQTTHVPFKGSAPAVVEVAAGRVTYMFHPTTGLKELVQAKRVRPLAVTGTAQRLADYPDVPTMAEAGFPGYEDVGVWFGVIAPAGTPAPIVARLNAAVQAALQRPATQDRLKLVGAVATGGTPQQFHEFVVRDNARWTAIIRAAKIEMPNG